MNGTFTETDEVRTAKNALNELHNDGCVSSLDAFNGLNLLDYEFGQRGHITHFQISNHVVNARYGEHHLDALHFLNGSCY
jgi:hypothetical protein